MRLTLSFVLAAIAAFFMPALLKAQPFTIQNHYYRDSCDKGIHFYLQTQPGTGLTMTTYFGDGNSTTNPVHPRGTLKHSYLYSLPGTYTVKHVLYDSGSPVDSARHLSLPKTVRLPIFMPLMT